MPKYAERPPQNGAHTHHHIVGQCCRMNASQSPSSILRRVSSNTGIRLTTRFRGAERAATRPAERLQEPNVRLHSLRLFSARLLLGTTGLRMSLAPGQRRR